MKHFITAVAVVLAAVVIPAADVSGTWSVQGDVVGNPVNFVLTLKQEGEKLSGQAALQGQSLPVVGTVEDKTVKFEFDVEHGGQTYTNVFTGTLKDGGVIDGTIAVGGVEGTFTAKKQ